FPLPVCRAVLLFVATAPAPAAFSTLSLHDALPISFARMVSLTPVPGVADPVAVTPARRRSSDAATTSVLLNLVIGATPARRSDGDRKSTRLNSSHDQISYAVSCLKKKTAQSSERT